MKRLWTLFVNFLFSLYLHFQVRFHFEAAVGRYYRDDRLSGDYHRGLLHEYLYKMRKHNEADYKFCLQFADPFREAIQRRKDVGTRDDNK